MLFFSFGNKHCGLMRAKELQLAKKEGWKVIHGDEAHTFNLKFISVSRGRNCPCSWACCCAQISIFLILTTALLSWMLPHTHVSHTEGLWLTVHSLYGNGEWNIKCVQSKVPQYWWVSWLRCSSKISSVTRISLTNLKDILMNNF